MRVRLHEIKVCLWLDDSESNRCAIPGKESENEGLARQATVSASCFFGCNWCIYLIYYKCSIRAIFKMTPRETWRSSGFRRAGYEDNGVVRAQFFEDVVGVLFYVGATVYANPFSRDTLRTVLLILQTNWLEGASENRRGKRTRSMPMPKRASRPAEA